MSNLQQNEIEQFKREIRLSQDRLKQSKQKKIIAKWAKANFKNEKWARANHKNI